MRNSRGKERIFKTKIDFLPWSCGTIQCALKTVKPTYKNSFKMFYITNQVPLQFNFLSTNKHYKNLFVTGQAV